MIAVAATPSAATATPVGVHAPTCLHNPAGVLRVGEVIGERSSERSGRKFPSWQITAPDVASAPPPHFRCHTAPTAWQSTGVDGGGSIPPATAAVPRHTSPGQPVVVRVVRGWAMPPARPTPHRELGGGL